MTVRPSPLRESFKIIKNVIKVNASLPILQAQQGFGLTIVIHFL